MDIEANMTSDWIMGTAELRRVVDRCMKDPAAHGGEILASSAYRQTLRFSVDVAPYSVVVKQYFPDRARSLPKRLLAILRRFVRQSAADREWRALLRLREAQISVPEPLAFARRAGGGALIVTPFHEGAKTLDRALDGYAFERRRYSLRQKLRTIWKHRRMALGFGVGANVMLLVPLLNFLCMPIAVVGGTALAVALDDFESREPAPDDQSANV